MNPNEIKKWWIPAVNTESYNYFPVLESIEECLKSDSPIYGHDTEVECQKECDLLNSV